MSLFSSIQLANNALIASQIGLQVTANNIANSNTPGYIREEMVLAAAPTQRKGNLLLGMGVEIAAIIQKTDRFLEERLRGALADLASGEAQESAYLQLESLIGELSDTDLSTSMNNFFASIADILNQPESISVRNLAVLRGETLASDLNRLSQRVREIRTEANDRVIDTATTINRLLTEISQLNVQIVTAEGGAVSESDAVGLRDRRGTTLEELSKIVDVRAVEQINGSVTVFIGGDFLVFEGNYREVEVELTSDRGLSAADIRIAETDKSISTSSGELGGLITARDQVMGGFLDGLDDFARTLIFEFNKIYSSGQGLKGHSQLTSEFSVDATNSALDQSSLTYTPTNGTLQVQVFNKQTGLTKTTAIAVPLGGLDSDMTLDDLTAQIDAIDGISATITPSRRLSITADSPVVEFTFANDTSGVLAALGISTFFTGIAASDMSVSQDVQDAPEKFAASKNGLGEKQDTLVAEELADFLDRELDSANGATLAVLYDRLTGEVTQGAAVSRAVAEGFRVFEQTLRGQQLAVSGVSLDEEAVKLIMYQRMFQATARYIATIDELLETLVNL